MRAKRGYATDEPVHIVGPCFLLFGERRRHRFVVVSVDLLKLFVISARRRAVRPSDLVRCTDPRWVGGATFDFGRTAPFNVQFVVADIDFLPHFVTYLQRHVFHLAVVCSGFLASLLISSSVCFGF